MGQYYVDFVCHSAKLIIALDGSQHKEALAIKYDSERTRFLRSRGYDVLRFWNGDVMRNREGVLDAIWFAATKPPPEICSR